MQAHERAPAASDERPRVSFLDPALSASANAALGVGSLLLTAAQVAFTGTYPKTPRGNVVDDFHGTQVADPYRWLETNNATQRAWVAKQNAITRTFLGTLPARAAIKDWLERSYAVGEAGRPRPAGDWTFYTERNGLEPQAALYVKGKNGKARVLVQPTDRDATGTLAISAYSPSPDGKHVAYALNDNGSDWCTWRIIDTASGKELTDVIQWTKDSSPEWLPDGSGFYYSALPTPAKGRELEEPVHDMAVKLHRLGTPQSADQLIHATPDQPDMTHSVELSRDDKWLIMTSGDLKSNLSTIAVRPADAPDAPFRKLIETNDASYTVLGSEGTTLRLITEAGAPRGRLVTLDFSQKTPLIQEILPQDPELVLQGAQFAGDRIYARYLRNGTSELRVFNKGALERTVELPDRGTVTAFWGDEDGKKATVIFTNYYTPEIEYAVDLATGKRTVTRAPRLNIDPADYQTTEGFARSSDGTLVPVFITHRRGLPRDGMAPTLDYAYGGFDNSLTPTYSRRFHCMLEMDGVVAVPQLRGGGEFGEDWHRGGNTHRKQNVFEDYKASARYLVEQRYTSPKRTILAGGSNGGTLVAATITQDPSICGAALPSVGVHDMLRYHLWTWGPGWIPEYGVSSNPRDFSFLYGYSPYHNVRKGTVYPWTLVQTGSSDDRVLPGHSFKLAAALQHAQAGPQATLLRTDIDTGHGAGKPVDKIIAQISDELAFALNAIDANDYAEKLKSSKVFA